MALDQATAALLERMAADGIKPVYESTLTEARGRMAAMRGGQAPGPDMASVRDTRVKASGGFVPVRVLTPVERPRGIIVYYHGGGWVIGGLADYEKVGRVLARRTGCAVLLVDYRLAPEYRFPTAVDDSWAALRWADERRAELANTTGVPLIVAGDSAGGNLSAVMAQRAKAAGGPSIALQVLVYPVTDCDLESTSYRDPANQISMPRESMVWYWDQYLPVAEARLHPDASPLRNADLLRLPPAVILTAEHDVLRDEGELYATRLMKAGVPVKHRRLAGQMHGFFTMVDILPGAAQGMDYIVTGIEEHLAGAPAHGGSLAAVSGRLRFKHLPPAEAGARVTGTTWLTSGPWEDPPPPPDLRLDRPHPARIYDYLLGGKDNYVADRAAAEEALTQNPNGRIQCLENRAFLGRVVRYLAAEAGIRQFLDVGTGLPTSPNVHEVAQAVFPDARIVYTDNDPIVLAHARALLTSSPEGRTAYIDADLRSVDSILASPGLRETLDLSQPVALLILAVMHFIPDEDGPYDLVARLLDALPAGSYLAVSHLTGDFTPQAWEHVAGVFARNGMVMKVRSRPEIERFFTGADIVEPGVQPIARWRPGPGDGPESLPADATVSSYGGVARRP